ncbi:MAG: carbon starvation protein A [Candidatus Sumerlaeota bacterium]|nr:carbon starvation protein A [Candidatus Sumerlaeota bacterium]
MNVLYPLLAGFALLVLATRSYPFFLSKRLGVDDANLTPAKRFADGRDYVPTRTHVVFAHHFAVIAGAGPIVGPTLALAFGYGPAWLWIVLGCILFGAVHDMTCMFISMREGGYSIADMSRRTLGAWGYFFFVSFLILMLTLVNAIFLNLSCKALTSAYPITALKMAPTDTLIRVFTDADGLVKGRIGGIATTSVFIITAFAPIMGWLVHRKRWSLPLLYAIAAVACVASVLVGFKFPLSFSEDEWRWIMSAYVFIACWIPVWLILQPRDFVNVQILYSGLALAFVGLLIYGFKGQGLNAPFTAVAEGRKAVGGPIWPFLFITVACGAISGFHSLAATGTTVKQISSESDVRRVGYNAMILEGALALLSLLLVASAMPSGEYFSIVYPVDPKASNPILAYAISMGYMLNHVFGLKIAIGSVLGILVLEGFVVTTLDTAVRLCRYMLQELWTFLIPAENKQAVRIMRSPFLNTAIAVGLMLFFALNGTIKAMWGVFGAGNQLIGALALTVVTVWLLQRGKSFWFTLAPALFMIATSFAMLVLFLKQNIQWGQGLAPAAGKGPLTAATAIMLVLAFGVVAVSVVRFAKNWFELRKPIPGIDTAAGPTSVH